MGIGNDGESDGNMIVEGLTNIRLVNERVFALFYKNIIKLGLLSHLAWSFYNT